MNILNTLIQDPFLTLEVGTLFLTFAYLCKLLFSPIQLAQPEKQHSKSSKRTPNYSTKKSSYLISVGAMISTYKDILK